MSFTIQREYNKRTSVIGASAQRLSDILVANSYTGNMIGDELTIRNPNGTGVSIRYGGSDVDGSNGAEIEEGDSKTWRASGPNAPVDPSRIYIFIASTKSIDISFRAV